MLEQLRYWYVKKIYADHNDSKAVKKALAELFYRLPRDYVGLNIGAGKTGFGQNVKNLEISSGAGIDYVGTVEDIPCGNDHFDLVIAQEVLEHVRFPERAISEIHRVLKRGGYAYIQLPFVIGYHPCPNDFWRFTHEGIEALVRRSDFEIEKKGVSVGPAVGFYRIAVEFFAVLFSALHARIYRPTKIIFSLLLYPVKWLDAIVSTSSEANRISGGYFLICRKS